MANQIREPQQGRSIEKKNKIIQAGYELFSEMGYHGATTVDIAKRAGVSTGIVYGYFQDKRDIMICVLQIYIDNVSAPVFKILDKVMSADDLEKAVPDVIDAVICAHEYNAKLHNTLHSLAASDEAVNAKFMSVEDDVTENFSKRLKEIGIKGEGLKERIHLAMNLLQSFAHEYVFDKHPYIDYEKMRGIVCGLVKELVVRD